MYKKYPRKTSTPGKATSKSYPSKTGKVPGKATAKTFSRKTGVPGKSHKAYRSQTGPVLSGYFTSEVGANNRQYINNMSEGY